jgi:Predicted sugar kinase
MTDTVEFSHITSTYPSVAVVLESRTAAEIHSSLSFPVYTASLEDKPTAFHDKIDLTVTLGGDGTILHASSLFATCSNVAPRAVVQHGYPGLPERMEVLRV